jgi:hypothetical protein
VPFPLPTPRCLTATFATLVALSIVRPALAQEPAAAAQPAAPSGEVRTKVAVLELGSLGLTGRDADLPRALDNYLRNSVTTIDGLQLIPLVDVQLVLQNPKHKKLNECLGGTRCAIDIGKVVGADRVVFGTIGAAGEAYSLNARSVDVKSGKESGKHTALIAGSRDALIPEIRLAAFKLLAPERIRGSLIVEINVDGVAVEIDGQQIGVTPLKEPVKNLAPGSHVVVVRRPGYSEFQQEFAIKPFETAKLRIKLEGAQKQP